MHAVVIDQKMSEPVMSHLRLKRSPQNPAIGVMMASVAKSAPLIQPICPPVRLSSS